MNMLTSLKAPRLSSNNTIWTLVFSPSRDILVLSAGIIISKENGATMGGPRLNVDKEKFVALVADLESKNTFANMLRLQEAICASEYGRSLALTVGNAYQYIKKFEIKLATKAGAKGESLNKIHNAGTVRMSRGDQWANDPAAKKWIDELRNKTRGLCSDIDPSDGKAHVDKKKAYRLEKMVAKAEKGSVKACVALMCVHCCAGDTSEVKNCEIVDCPLYQLRPWKKDDNEFAEVELDD